MALRFEYDYLITMKLSQWAEYRIQDDTDFIDYWYNLFLSESKKAIDEPETGNLASFGVARWKNEFEIYVDKYTPIHGMGFFGEERCYLATYAQYLVYELQTPSKVIAELYGKPMLGWMMEHYNRFHTFGSNLFMQYFTDEWGLPPGIDKPFRTVNR